MGQTAPTQTAPAPELSDLSGEPRGLFNFSDLLDQKATSRADMFLVLVLRQMEAERTKNGEEIAGLRQALGTTKDLLSDEETLTAVLRERMKTIAIGAVVLAVGSGMFGAGLSGSVVWMSIAGAALMIGALVVGLVIASETSRAERDGGRG